jgi:hypothetical protein
MHFRGYVGYCYTPDLALIINHHDEYLTGRIGVPVVRSVIWSRSMNWYAQNEQKTNVVPATPHIAR